MKIGLLSDTHGSLDEKILHHFETCDEIWHAGDIGNIKIMTQLANFKPLKAVYGNIDDQEVRDQCPLNQRFICESLEVWITHIGGIPPIYNPRVQTALSQKIPDIFICGHSHILRVIRDPQHPPLLYLNPGAAGKYGLHTIRTLLCFNIIQGKVSNMQVIELGFRFEGNI